MILVTNATTFVGRAIVYRLVADGQAVRCLVQASPRQLPLPTGVPFSVASGQMHDVPAVRAALQDVTAAVHLIGEETLRGEQALRKHPEGTANLLSAMQQADVSRIIYISRLGADSASAYPVFRIRGETETLVTQSGLDYTVIQPAVTYGAEDVFSNVLAMVAKSVPVVLPVPDPGLARFQPLWVGDLARCAASAVSRDDLANTSVPIGGPEHFTLEQLVSELLGVLGVRRLILRARMPFVRGASSLLSMLFPRNPIPLWMLDIVEKGSATDLGAVPRNFGFEPARFSRGLDYLRRRRAWGGELVRFLLDLGP